MAGYLLVHPGRRVPDRLLALVLAAVLLRLGKAIGVYLLPDLNVLYHVVWFGVLAFGGPLLWCYASRLRDGGGGRSCLPHLVPPALLVIALAIRPDLMHLRPLYLVTLGWYLAYVAAASIRLVGLVRNRRRPRRERIWLVVQDTAFQELDPLVQMSRLRRVMRERVADQIARSRMPVVLPDEENEPGREYMDSLFEALLKLLK